MTDYISAKQISILYRRLQKYINKELKKFQISSSEYSYLLLLYENNYELSQDELVKLSNVDRAAVTRAIVSLEKKEFLIKEASKSNSRRNVIRLTEKGVNIEKDVMESVMNWNKLLHKGLETDKIENMIQSLNTMVDNTEEI